MQQFRKIIHKLSLITTSSKMASASLMMTFALASLWSFCLTRASSQLSDLWECFSVFSFQIWVVLNMILHSKSLMDHKSILVINNIITFLRLINNYEHFHHLIELNPVLHPLLLFGFKSPQCNGYPDEWLHLQAIQKILGLITIDSVSKDGINKKVMTNKIKTKQNQQKLQQKKQLKIDC